MSKKEDRAEYLPSARKIASDMKSIAYDLLESEQFVKSAERLLEASREITSRTLTESVPDAGLLFDLKNLLDALGVSFALIGGIAVGVHGQLRGTDDIDALVDHLPDPASTKDPRFMETFGFYRASSSTGTVLTIDHRRLGQVELLVASDPLQRTAIATAQEETVMRSRVPVVTPEALVALKSVAMSSSSRDPAKRDKDASDIVSIGLRNDLCQEELFALLGEERAQEIVGMIATAQTARRG